MTCHKRLSRLTAVSVLIFVLGLPVSLAQGAEEVMDLEIWAQVGMPESLRQKMVIQSLSHRARPALSGDFILKMVRYGGENLALSYVQLDNDTAMENQAPISPQVMERLMDSGVPRSDIEKIIQAAQSGGALNSQPAAAVVPESLARKAEITQEDLEPIETVPPEAPAAPRAPKIYPAPKFAEEPSKASMRKVPQILYPGVPADPARPMPPQPGPYEIRKPRGSEGLYMGVTEAVKPDGHVYQVNSNGRRESQGFEVLSRPSGHKVHRFFSGRTDQTYNPGDGYDGGYDPTGDVSYDD
ncbi:MAG: hypothetical protein LBP22_15460 [Deltaproteobacteria bacterium]|nr:hypothetical protein [Deltaproteobacteria bacterium]